MNTTASLMLLSVAVIAVLAVLGALWAVKGAPKAPPQGARRKAVAPVRKSAAADGAAAAAAVPPKASEPEEEEPEADSRLQTHQQRIDAMRALLHRGDEKARKQSATPQFADTMPFVDDEEVSPPTMPLGWRLGDPEPGRKKGE